VYQVVVTVQVRFVVHDPHIWGPIVSEISMNVKDNSTVSEIKREVLPKLTSSDSYGTYCGERHVDIICQPPEPEQAALTDSMSPSVTEQLIQRFGRSDPPKPPACFQMPFAFLFCPASTYGEASKWHEVAQFFVSLMREAKLDNELSLEYQGVKEDSRVTLSVDIDLALLCPECKKPLDLGHVYHVLGTDLAGVYTTLDAFCSQCGLKRSVGSLPPAIVAVHDQVSAKFLGSVITGTQLVIHASNWIHKEQLRRQSERVFENGAL
jgi:hypothetical protein